MKIIKTAVAITMGTLFAGAAFAQSDFGIERRDHYQDSRIDRGVATGRITSRETVRLESQQAQIERMEARARADGRLSGRERARIDHAQDRLGRDIYRQSHDRQTSNPGSHNPGRHYGWDRGNGHRRFGQHDDHRGNGNAWGRGHSNGHSGGHQSPAAGTAPRTGSDSHAGRSDRYAGRQASMQQAQARSTPSPRSTTGGSRGTDSGRRSR